MMRASFRCHGRTSRTVESVQSTSTATRHVTATTLNGCSASGCSAHSLACVAVGDSLSIRKDDKTCVEFPSSLPLCDDLIRCLGLTMIFLCVYAAGDELSDRRRLPGRRGELRRGVGNGGQCRLGDNRGEGGNKEGKEVRVFFPKTSMLCMELIGSTDSRGYLLSRDINDFFLYVSRRQQPTTTTTTTASCEENLIMHSYIYMMCPKTCP